MTRGKPTVDSSSPSKIVIPEDLDPAAVVEMKVHSIAVSGAETRPLLILKDSADSLAVPVWLSPAEAGQIVSQAPSAKVQADGLAIRVLNSLDVEIDSCHLTHLEGHYQYGYLKVKNHPNSSKIAARAGEILPLVNYLDKPIYVHPGFIRESRETDATMMDTEKEVQRVRKTYFH